LLSVSLILGSIGLLANYASGSVRNVPQTCKPVKVCEPVRVVPPVKVCEPVKMVPIPKTCELVKTCDPVKVHGHTAYAWLPLLRHHKHYGETVYYSTQDQPTPAGVKPAEPTQAPANAPAPPLPDKA
jgi:hypothetical protein